MLLLWNELWAHFIKQNITQDMFFTDNFYAKTYLQTGDYYTKLGKVESKDCAVFKWDNFENTTKMSYATPLILADPVDRRLKRMASNFK